MKQKLKAKDILERLLETEVPRKEQLEVASRMQAYYDGTGHWSAEERKEREIVRQKPAVTVNMIGKYADMKSGIQRQNRSDYRYFPVEGGDVEKANIMNMLKKHVETRSNWRFLSAQGALEGNVMTESWFEVQYDLIKKDIKLRLVSSYDVAYDNSSVSYDLNEDAEWVATYDWYPVEKAVYLFPKEEKYIRSMEGNSLKIDNKVYKFIYDTKKRRVRVTQFQHKIWENVDYWVGPEGEISYEAMDGWVKLNELREQVYFYTLIGDKIVDGPFLSFASPYFTLVRYAPKFIAGYPINTLLQVKDLQDVTNLYLSEAIDNVKKSPKPNINYEEGSIDAENEAKLNDLEAGGQAIKWLNINGYREGSPRPFINEPIKAVNQSLALMRDVLNINEAISGQAPGRVDSAMGINALISTNMASFNMELDNFDWTQVIIARTLIPAFQRLYSEGRIFRIIGDDAKEYILQTQGAEGTFIMDGDGNPIKEIKGDISIGDYDVVVSKSPETPTVRLSNLMLAQQIIQLIPDPRLVMEMIEMTDFPRKDKWRAILASIPQEQEAQPEEQLQQLLSK